MENYKKEKCSKQHLKIDLGQDESEDIFMLANPMTYGDVTTPTSPSNYNIPSRAVSNPNTPTNPTYPTHHTGGNSTAFTRGTERWSLKSKNKSHSFFKRFGRISTGGSGMAVHKDEEDGGDGSSGSEHEDPFSPNSSSGAGDLIHPHRQMSEPPKSPSSNVEHYATSGRHHSGGHSSRDSGFSSERESVSLLKDDSVTIPSNNPEDIRLSPVDLEDYKPAGMEALEILHNQLQLLVKRDTDEETDSVCVYEQVIANLSKQLEDQSLAVDVLRQSEANLKLSVRLSEQRAVEAETKLAYTAERCLYLERKHTSLTSRYKSLRRRHMEEGGQPLQRHSKTERKRHSAKASPGSSLHSSGSPYQQHSHTQPSVDGDRIPPQRVQSQTLYDRQNKWEQNGTGRPNTAQGFHYDQNAIVASITSLSHTETSV